MPLNYTNINSIGNREILNLHKTAFLCSRQTPASIVLKCYDWAIAQREAGNCVISGFHSQIEKDVLHYLLKGTQPIIIVLARGLKQKIEPKFKKPLEQGRLLIISPFQNEINRVTIESSILRNKIMLEIADEIIVGYAKQFGYLEVLLLSYNNLLIKYL